MEFLDQIQHYWFIIVFIGSVIGSWVRYEGKLDAVKKENKDLKDKYAEDIAEVKADFEKQIKELRERLRAVEIKAAMIDGIAGDIKAINVNIAFLVKKAGI